MNIDDCIEVLQAQKAGKNIVMRECNLQVPTNWYPKDRESLFNFIAFEYRLTPDVVYKIEYVGDEPIYSRNELDWAEGSTVSKGYWVEGEL